MEWNVILIIIGLIAYVLIALVFGNIADEKGYSKAAHFVCCLLFGIIGWIYVGALPNRTSMKIQIEILNGQAAILKNQKIILKNQKTILQAIKKQHTLKPAKTAETGSQPIQDLQ